MLDVDAEFFCDAVYDEDGDDEREFCQGEKSGQMLTNGMGKKIVAFDREVGKFVFEA